MLSIFSCASWPSVCLLRRNVCLGLSPTFWLGFLSFCYWVAWAACIFWKLILCQLFHLLLFSPILRTVFSSHLWYIYTLGWGVAQMVKNLPAVWETWVSSLGQEEPVDKGMATHSSIHAWRIPWTEKPGRLQSMGLQRLEHDWANNMHIHWNITHP